MISEAFTPSACSSSSARPVRRLKLATPRILPMRSSTIAAIAFDVSSDVPGGSRTLTCTQPSSNGGRKSRPSPMTTATLAPTATATPPRIGAG